MKLVKPSCLSDTIFQKLKVYRQSLRISCTACNGTGVISFDEEKKMVFRCKECGGKFESVRKYLDVNISPRHVDFTLESVKDSFDKRCYSAFEAICSNALRVITNGHVFISQKMESTSFGVSTMGTILLKRLVDLGVDCCAVSAQEVSDCFFNFSDDKDRNERLTKLLDYYENVQVLMITDFADQFKTSGTNFRAEKFMDFVMKRKINNRHIIFCSSVHWNVIDKLYTNIRLPEHIKANSIVFELLTSIGKGRATVSDNLKKLPGMDALSDYMKSPTQTKQEKKSPEIPEEVQPAIPEKKLDNDRTIRRTTTHKKDPI